MCNLYIFKNKLREPGFVKVAGRWDLSPPGNSFTPSKHVGSVLSGWIAMNWALSWVGVSLREYGVQWPPPATISTVYRIETLHVDSKMVFPSMDKWRIKYYLHPRPDMGPLCSPSAFRTVRSKVCLHATPLEFWICSHFVIPLHTFWYRYDTCMVPMHSPLGLEVEEVEDGW